MDEIRKECESIIDEVCEKYNYSREDEEGNDSLRTVLLKAVPAMLKDSPKEDRELFYQMLRHTPIVITENLTEEGFGKLVEEYIGNPNPHIEEEKADLGEYGKGVVAGAYVSEAIFDENLEIKGKKSFVYVQKVERDKPKEFFGTDINVSHLIHELGHAWHAEKEQYTMSDDGKLSERVGTSKFMYSFEKSADGKKFIKKFEGYTGLLIEEGMNTIAEEKAMAAYMGISLEEMKRAYRSILVNSNYQGLVSNAVEYLLEKTSKQNFEKWRLYDDQTSKANIEKLMEKTEFWKNREQDILPDSNSERSYDKKRGAISKFGSQRVQEFFQEYEELYFPDIATMTPLGKIDNVLDQFFSLKDVKYSMEIEEYKGLIERINWEIYSIINQAAAIKAKEEVAKSVEGASRSEVETATHETKQGVQNLQQRQEQIQEGETRDEE